jgi:hypothetical protein
MLKQIRAFPSEFPALKGKLYSTAQGRATAKAGACPISRRFAALFTARAGRNQKTKNSLKS